MGGGALHKRKFGENLSQHFESHIQAKVPSWFVNNAKKFIRKEESMPMDQHELVALIAPRPVCLGTATLDIMADPEGEFASCVEASKVYNLFGSNGMPENVMPLPDKSITGDISFHYRTGRHDQVLEDWIHYWEIADIYL